MGYCERPSLALSSLAGAGGTPCANLVVCALLCALSACPRRASLRFVRAGRLLFHGSPLALTLGCAHTLLCGRFLCSRGCWKSRLVVGVFACGWLGFVFTRGACSPFGVCAFGVGALDWGGGTVWSRRPFAPLACLLACLRAHALVWACWRVRCSLGCGVTVMGRDNVVPPHTAWRCPRCVACKRRVGALSWCANTRAHGERKRGGRGEPRGADRGGLAGGCGWWHVGW